MSACIDACRGGIIIESEKDGLFEMTKIAIVSVPSAKGHASYRAIAGRNQSQGKTAGQALDALTRQLSADESGMMVVVQNFRPDRYFSREQQLRLEQLMLEWQAARDRGKELSPAERAELEALVNAELRASAQRAAELADELGR